MFTQLNKVETRVNVKRTIKVDIVKFRKDGTKREFFVPMFEGKRLNKTLFARKYDAVNLAKAFIKYKENN